ncbi:hypothetical protein DVA67_008235 [Solirubrobacter sp. CPCC 204708]|uniref:Uncharacterized protein n=1 Tax=Solirubrobacter deserti TaxID=2282478 RepID=A0ABT4RDU7_9ACTN|nr:hypothetical protein [Solirubrobacter deserti]MBE2315959.1 hypothetical protein [Solirubrobacter deserti]MDA0136710.1 hypothetical protein [Solirubrobacter deserti]
MPDELTSLLRALVATQEEIVDALAEVSDDVRALERRLDLLETAAGMRGEAQQTQVKTRRLVTQAREIHLRSTELRDAALDGR